MGETHRHVSVFSESSNLVMQLVEVMLDQAGINLSGFKPDFLQKKIHDRVRQTCSEDMAAYVALLRCNLEEQQKLHSSLGVQCTAFFRNPEVFVALEFDILPRLATRIRLDGEQELRIWSAGCSSGEEPYSLAILGKKSMEQQSLSNVYVFATDISNEALKRASIGVYGRESLLETRLEVIDRYFEHHEEKYHLHRSVRELVLFSHADVGASEGYLPRESVFRTYHIVACRNVLIYYMEKYRRQILQNLKNAVDAGGYLVLGEAETLPDELAREFVQPYGNIPIYQKI